MKAQADRAAAAKAKALLEELVETGIDAINPVQPSAVGDTAVLKQRFQDTLAFVGGIIVQYFTLELVGIYGGTEMAVDVRTLLIAGGVPFENIVTEIYF